MSEEKESTQLEIFELLDKVRERQPASLVPAETPAPGPKRKNGKGKPAQGDFFELDIPLLEFAFKDDVESMEAPVYSLSTKRDMKVLSWESQDGKKRITVSPSAEVGRATIFDKDVLIYATSQLMAALKAGKEINRVVRFTVGDFLLATDRSAGGDDYDRFYAAMKRLHGTTITVQEKGKSIRWAQGFSLINSWGIIEQSIRSGQRMVQIECTLSEWLYEAIGDRKVLTISPDYFKLRKPIERRLYEIARKHCGRQTEFRINLDVLRDKCGVADVLRNFRLKIRELEKEQTLPEYLIGIDHMDMVTFLPRSHKG